ncbi:ornithine cyclodeaminase family protein [Pseudonocardia acidicola]|uniref:Ornithine cyclodeaminase family protein n=1 Tax=Pseudonocardia acidicola TaxID=2724939 RepID=A0ABX1SBN1_9PSEU|nr:ornithine cyclodeaminase family protein [Pseudonocardia acidicola]NMH98309.1 ornithine cyclodeaminase family protein [Pseudonocardia acidicola]
MLLLHREQIEDLLDLDELIDALGPAMADLSSGRASVPDRVAAGVPNREGLLTATPGYVPSSQVLMAELVSWYPHNAGTGLPTRQAVIVAFDPDTGEPSALLDGTAIITIRTGACSALSVRLLARPDAEVLTIIGTGVQARSHARAVSRVRRLRQIRIAGRDPVKAADAAVELSAELPVDVVVVASIREALDGADIVCATTHAVVPVVRRAWLSPGVHVASVGHNSAGREIDDDTIADALVCVESRAAVLAPFPAGSNDLLEPIENGVIKPDHLHAELGELVAGARPGRSSPEQITLFKSVGVAVEDAAAVALVLQAAWDQGVGDEIRI